MTFVELIVTIAVLSIVMVALMNLIQSFYRNNAYLLESTAALASARSGVNATVKALREASYGDDGSYPIVAASTTGITFFADIDQDSSIEKVNIYLSNQTLYETVTNAVGSPPIYPGTPQLTYTIATDVRNTGTSPLFTYYDSSGATLSATSTNIGAIRSVKMQLLVDLNPNRAPDVYTITSSATLRNL